MTEPNCQPELIPAAIEHRGSTWMLYTAQNQPPLVRDLDWAERLQYQRPRTIRDLIRRLANAGRLGEVVCRTVRQTPGSPGGRPSTEYYLTQGQALKVAAKSETDFADSVLDELIEVYLLARGQFSSSAGQADRLLPPHPLPAEGSLDQFVRALVKQKVPLLVEKELCRFVRSRLAVISGLDIENLRVSAAELKIQGQTSESTIDAVGELLRGWQALCLEQKKEAMTAQEALTELRGHVEQQRISASYQSPYVALISALGELSPPKSGRLPDPIALGYLLRRLKKRVVHGLCMEASQRTNRTEWAVKADR